MMLNKSEQEEKFHLEETISKLQKALKVVDAQILASYSEVLEAKKETWQNKAEMDQAERAANLSEIYLTIETGEKAVMKKKNFQKLIQTPYFGRVDFKAADQMKSDTLYIGMHSFSEKDTQENLIYDWRSPISSIFYDFNVGSAYYKAPMGTIDGEIFLKRQYKIRDSVMEYMIESSVNINDDILQKELSHTSDEKMKNIVATIQKEQNVIIRNETSNELIIQGVAGSGKTSVALHRVAYLLYRYKATISSENILIISPNKVFSDYISNVLPELGEEEILEMNFEELAFKELEGISRFQTFYEQVSELIDQANEPLIERIRYKASVNFLEELKSFITAAQTKYFIPTDISIEHVKISKKNILYAYDYYKKLPIQPRLEKAAAYVIKEANWKYKNTLSGSISRKIKTAIKKMFKFQNILSLYKEFYREAKKTELFKLRKDKRLEYADVFPVIYLKIYFQEINSFDAIKHLLVDEMQDYTPIQYQVLSKLFKCKKTILGDSNQSVNPYSSTSIKEIQKVFPEAYTVELLKSYRSTIEIINFVQKINKNSKMIPIERHGEEPEIIECCNLKAEIEEIQKQVRTFLKSEHNSLGIICKTADQASLVYERIKELDKRINILDFHSTEFHEGITVTFAHVAKGLEFDKVIVPFADYLTYETELDKSLLYIACTRAMHKLVLTYHSRITSFLEY